MSAFSQRVRAPSHFVKNRDYTRYYKYSTPWHPCMQYLCGGPALSRRCNSYVQVPRWYSSYYASCTGSYSSSTWSLSSGSAPRVTRPSTGFILRCNDARLRSTRSA